MSTLKKPSVSIAALFLAIGLYMVAFLASESPPSQAPIDAVVWSAFVSVFIAGGFVVVWLAIRPVSVRFSRLVLPGYIMFAIYGYLWSFVVDLGVFDLVNEDIFFSNKIFLPLSVVVTPLVYLAASRFITWNVTIARYALILVLVLTFWNFTTWGIGQVRSDSFETERIAAGIELERPDELFPIYWMLFDGYARDDVLAREFEFDNSRFLEQLESRGFVVNRNTTASFMHSKLAIPVLMELENFGTISPTSVKSLTADRSPANWRFEESMFAVLLGDVGYQIMEFSSQRSDSPVMKVFSISFYESTPLRAVLNHLGSWPDSVMSGFVNNMEITAAQSGAQDALVFSYNFPPHPPYLFNSDGSNAGPTLIEPNATIRRNEWQQKEKYTGQLEYVNTQIMTTVDQILDGSPVDPLIVILSDHGPASSFVDADGSWYKNPTESFFLERIGVLSAVLLPESCDSAPRDEWNASINTFRVILNRCFGTELPLEPADVYWGIEGEFEHYPNAVWSAGVGAS